MIADEIKGMSQKESTWFPGAFVECLEDFTEASFADAILSDVELFWVGLPVVWLVDVGSAVPTSRMAHLVPLLSLLMLLLLVLKGFHYFLKIEMKIFRLKI